MLSVLCGIIGPNLLLTLPPSYMPSFQVSSPWVLVTVFPVSVFQWTSSSWTDPVTGRPHIGFTVCSVAEEQVDNWLRTPYIYVEGVSTLYVNISFFMRECQEYPGKTMAACVLL